jgi:hypothetical protein
MILTDRKLYICFLGSNKETLREAFPVCAAFAAALHIRPPQYHLFRTREVKNTKKSLAKSKFLQFPTAPFSG